MARLRFNGIGDPGGTVNPITIASPSAASCSWHSPPGFPAIASPDYAVIVVNQGSQNENICYITAYDGTSTTATILQGQEGSSAANGPGPSWIHGPTAFDIIEALVSTNNLSDLTSTSTARINLGLGSAATQPTSAFDPAGAAATAQSNAETFASAAAAAAQAAAEAASVPVSDLPISISNGGTGQTSRQAAMDALAGAVTSGFYLRGNGSHVVLVAIQAVDVPTLNQSTTGTAANLSGTPTLPNGTKAITQSPLDNTQNLATTAYVDGAVSTSQGLALLKANNLSDVSSKTTSLTNIGGANRYVPVSVVTAATVNVLANQLVPFDTTSNAIVATLPNAPLDGTVVGLKLVVAGVGASVTYNCAGTDHFNKAGGPQTGTLTLANQAAFYQYQASSGIWFNIGDDIPLSQLDARYLQLSGGIMSGSIDMGGGLATPNPHKITGGSPGTNPTDFALVEQLPVSIPPYGSATFVGHSQLVGAGTAPPNQANRSVEGKFAALLGIPAGNIVLLAKSGSTVGYAQASPGDGSWASVRSQVIPPGGSVLAVGAAIEATYGYTVKPSLLASTEDSGLVVFLNGINDADWTYSNAGGGMANGLPAFINGMRSMLSRSIAGLQVPWTDASVTLGGTWQTWSNNPVPIQTGPSLAFSVVNGSTAALKLPKVWPGGWVCAELVGTPGRDASGSTISWSSVAGVGGTAVGGSTVSTTPASATAAGTGNGPFTLTRTTGSWLTDFAALGQIIGQGISYSGSPANNKIIGASATVLTLLYGGSPGAVTGAITAGATTTTVAAQGYGDDLTSLGVNTITAVTVANPAVITTGAVLGNNLQTGQYVLITDVVGATAVNGYWPITVINGNQFSIPVNNTNAYVSGGHYSAGFVGMAERFYCPASDAGATITGTASLGTGGGWGFDGWTAEAVNQSPKIWIDIGATAAQDPATIAQFNAYGASIIAEFSNPYIVQGLFAEAVAASSATLTSNIASNSTTTIDVTTVGTAFNPGPGFAGGFAFPLGIRSNANNGNIEWVWVTHVAPAGGSSWNGITPSIPAGATLVLTVVRQVSGSNTLLDNTTGTTGQLCTDMTWWFTDSIHPNLSGASEVASLAKTALLGAPATQLDTAHGAASFTQGKTVDDLGIVDGYRFYTAGYTVGTATPANNHYYFVPFWKGMRWVLKDIGIEVTTLGTSWVGAFGIYYPDGTGGRPGRAADLFGNFQTLNVTVTANSPTVTVPTPNSIQNGQLVSIPSGSSGTITAVCYVASGAGTGTITLSGNVTGFSGATQMQFGSIPIWQAPPGGSAIGVAGDISMAKNGGLAGTGSFTGLDQVFEPGVYYAGFGWQAGVSAPKVRAYTGGPGPLGMTQMVPSANWPFSVQFFSWDFNPTASGGGGPIGDLTGQILSLNLSLNASVCPRIWIQMAAADTDLTYGVL